MTLEEAADQAAVTTTELLAEYRVKDVLAERGRAGAESWAMARLCVELEAGGSDAMVTACVRGLLRGLGVRS